MGPKKHATGSQEKAGTTKKKQKDKMEKKLEEQTFGMKNKNKSSKVQQFIATATKAVKNTSLYTDGEQQKQAKKKAAEAKLLEEEALRSLFNDAVSNQHGRSKADKANDALKLGIDKQSKEVMEILDTISTDSESESEDEDENGGANMVFVNGEDDSVQAVEAVEVFKEKTIEDMIEEQRAKLLASGQPGTPVTNESFGAWRAAKLAKRQADAEARMKAEQTKKKGGKGLSILSGKELFNYKKELFVDDNAAISAVEEKALTAETAVVADAEEDKVAVEREKLMKDQEQLAEIFRLEEEENQRRLAEWRARCEATYRRAKAAAAVPVKGPPVFVFDVGAPESRVQVNGMVFAIKEDEMLDEFDDADATDAEAEGEAPPTTSAAAPAAAAAAPATTA